MKFHKPPRPLKLPSEGSRVWSRAEVVDGPKGSLHKYCEYEKTNISEYLFLGAEV